MEWKPPRGQEHDSGTLLLGNFLSGMETRQKDSSKKRYPNLGNFLSGMETSILQELLAYRQRLGNFLSGMETVSTSTSCPPWVDLGNFLSGMETPRRTTPSYLDIAALETSLVEWKPCSPRSAAEIL